MNIWSLLRKRANKVMATGTINLRAIKAAAEHGCSAAEYALALYYFNSSAGANSDTGMHWLIRAAQHGSAPAKLRLGEYLLRGDNINKDVARAVALLEEASDAGISSASYRLSELYQAGMDIPIDLEKADYYSDLSGRQESYCGVCG